MKLIDQTTKLDRKQKGKLPLETETDGNWDDSLLLVSVAETVDQLLGNDVATIHNSDSFELMTTSNDDEYPFNFNLDTIDSEPLLQSITTSEQDSNIKLPELPSKQPQSFHSTPMFHQQVTRDLSTNNVSLQLGQVCDPFENWPMIQTTVGGQGNVRNDEDHVGSFASVSNSSCIGLDSPSLSSQQPDLKETEAGVGEKDKPRMGKPKKKRSYFRRSQHSKEEVDQFLEQKKKEKRERNRVLAAQSRKRQKAEMQGLRNRNAALEYELSRAYDQIQYLQMQHQHTTHCSVPLLDVNTNNCRPRKN